MSYVEITIFPLEFKNLLNWITTDFLKIFWIEYWIESILGKIQTLIESDWVSDMASQKSRIGHVFDPLSSFSSPVV